MMASVTADELLHALQTGAKEEDESHLVKEHGEVVAHEEDNKSTELLIFSQHTEQKIKSIMNIELLGLDERVSIAL